MAAIGVLSMLAGAIGGAWLLVLLGDGTFGLLSYRDLARVPAQDWPHTRVRDVAERPGEMLVVDPDDDLGDALVELAETEGRRALVLELRRLAAAGRPLR